MQQSVEPERLMQIIGTQHVEILLLREQVQVAQSEARSAAEMATRRFVCERPCCQDASPGEAEAVMDHEGA